MWRGDFRSRWVLSQYHFVKSDGSLWTMGGNNYGQLGNGTTTDRSVPVQIETSGVVEVSAGTYQTFYRKTDGSLWTVGYNGLWTTWRWNDYQSNHARSD